MLPHAAAIGVLSEPSSQVPPIQAKEALTLRRTVASGDPAFNTSLPLVLPGVGPLVPALGAMEARPAPSGVGPSRGCGLVPGGICAPSFYGHFARKRTARTRVRAGAKYVV